MDLGSTFLVLALLILVGMFITRPLFEGQAVSQPKSSNGNKDQEHERSTLLAERDRLLTALQELDFDNVLGKIPEEEYPEQRKEMMMQGVEILKKLDAIQEKTARSKAAIKSDADAEARLEAVIAARSASLASAGSTSAAPSGQPAQAVSSAAGVDDEIEKLISNRRQGRKELSSGFCPKCGKPVQKSDVFCPKCGAKLS